MEIQLIKYYGKNTDFNVAQVSSFENPKSPDMFDLNIIDLRDLGIWYNSEDDSYKKVDSIQNWKSINQMIKNSRKTKFLFIYPRNCNFLNSYYYFGKKKEYSEKLKNLLDYLPECLNYLSEFLRRTVVFENTETKVDDNVYLKADFYFQNDFSCKVLLTSEKSNKITCIQDDRFICTTLGIDKNEELSLFLKKIGLLKNDKEDIPEWMDEISFFDDIEQKRKIEDNQKIIQVCENDILIAQEKLYINNKFKSILYTTGDELVEVVKEILTDIFEIDFSNFEDKKKEDISFIVNKNTFIGEIKGVNKNISTSNLSQLDNHFTHFVERHGYSEIDQESIKKLLIMNHQKDKALEQRDKVDSRQIELAEGKYNLLIVETVELLKMYEKFKANQITKEECYRLLCGTGILKID